MSLPSTKEGAAPRTRRAQSETAISMRVSKPTLDLIDDAAVAMGKTRTEFVLESARRHAIDVLLDQRLFVIDEAQHEVFMRILENPPPPSARLRALMRQPAPWEK